MLHSAARHAEQQKANRESWRRRRRASLWSFAVGGGICLGAYALGSAFPPSMFTLLFPRLAPPPPDPTSPEAVAEVQSIESQLQRLHEVLRLRAKTVGPNAEYYEARPYVNYPPERAVNSLTAGALRGAGKLAVSPIVFARTDESESRVFLHVGRGLCGHDGIVHGGLLATLLDEALARTAFFNLPSHVGVTASLTINYKAPTMADQFIVIRTKIETVSGRKATVLGVITDLSGKTLVEASGLFIEPKYAKYLLQGDVKAAMGHRAEPAQVSMPMPGSGEVVVHGKHGHPHPPEIAKDEKQV